MEGSNRYSLKLLILRHFADGAHRNKFNVLGRPFQLGALEAQSGRAFTDLERADAGRCFDELIRSGYLEPTYRDITDPGNWLIITERGKASLASGALDDLDAALFVVDTRLVELRHGAWEAAGGTQPDKDRQAAHSGRELITKLLHALAPAEEVMTQPWFSPAPDSANGITRKHRVRLAIQKRASGSSQSDAKLIEQAGQLLETLYQKLSAEAHALGSTGPSRVREYLAMTETALRLILL